MKTDFTLWGKGFHISEEILSNIPQALHLPPHQTLFDTKESFYQTMNDVMVMIIETNYEFNPHIPFNFSFSIKNTPDLPLKIGLQGFHDERFTFVIHNEENGAMAYSAPCNALQYNRFLACFLLFSFNLVINTDTFAQQTWTNQEHLLIYLGAAILARESYEDTRDYTKTFSRHFFTKPCLSLHLI